MTASNRLLVFRFSAMGDVAMCAAVVRDFCQQNKHIEVIMVSRPSFAAFFEDIENIHFHPLDTKKRHRGIHGLFKLSRELHAYHPIAIADLHNNLRSNLLSGYLRYTKIPIKQIDKGRKEKKALVRKKSKRLQPLHNTIERYADVFRKLGFPLTLHQQLIPQKKKIPSSYQYLFSKDIENRIGISPFAKHPEKIYPLEKMEIVVQNLSLYNIQLFIFGGGYDEKVVAEEWEKRFPNVISLVGKTTLQEELAIISNLNIMVSMDSAGMHLASLMGIKVLSIWGATHPYAGFLGYGQDEKDTIQIDLYCRPCSVYGNKPCYRGDHACMHSIDPGIIIARIKEKLGYAQKSFPH